MLILSFSFIQEPKNAIGPLSGDLANVDDAHQPALSPTGDAATY